MFCGFSEVCLDKIYVVGNWIIYCESSDIIIVLSMFFEVLNVVII